MMLAARGANPNARSASRRLLLGLHRAGRGSTTRKQQHDTCAARLQQSKSMQRQGLAHGYSRRTFQSGCLCLVARGWEQESFITNCEASTIQRTTLTSSTETLAVKEKSASGWKETKRRIKKAFRLWKRLIKLAISLAPVALLYPIQRLLSTGSDDDKKKDAHHVVLQSNQAAAIDSPLLLGWYLKLCLYCVEWSGAAVIKLMQWAGSRPDLFGQDFCAVFSTLQDDTTPHSWRHTERVLRQAYGDNWQDQIRLDKKVIGSGCIGQVYSGHVVGQDGTEQKVAVKVLHPNVEEDIDSDLDLMRLVASLLNRFDSLHAMKYMNVEGVVEDFASLLKTQLDLRNEAAHLQRFNDNFKGVADVQFPKLVNGYEPTKDVLIETFCEGVPVINFARENQNDPDLLRNLCFVGIRAICKMIFQDNYLHGDLHPGNVFVSPDHKFIVLDVGMVTEFTDADHRLIVDILTSFIRKDGRRAGQLMIDDTNTRNATDRALQEELYIDKIEALTIAASGKNYFMEHLGSYISYICEAAATHHVMMNQAFVSAALAIKIQEGIALALDPSVQIKTVANPIILQTELQRKLTDIVKGVQQSALDKTNQAMEWSGLTPKS